MRQDFQGTTLWDQISATQDEDGHNYDPAEMEVFTKAFEKGVVAFRRVGELEPLGLIVFTKHENATDAILAFGKTKKEYLKRQPKPKVFDDFGI